MIAIITATSMLAIYVRPLAFATDLISNCAKTPKCFARPPAWQMVRSGRQMRMVTENGGWINKKAGFTWQNSIAMEKHYR